MPSDNPIPIVVDSRLRIPVSVLPPETVDALKAEFTHDNPDHAKERRRLDARRWSKGKPTKSPEKRETWREEGDDLTLPRGGLARVRAILDEHGIAVRWIDRRSEGTGPCPVGYVFAPHIENVRFQLDMVDAAKKTQNCILRGPTGSGKSSVAARLAIAVGLCTLVLVQTRELFEQWKRRLVADLRLREDDVGIIQGSKARIRPITIAMVQTFAKKADKFRGVFGLVVFDEVQRAAAETFYPAVDACDAKYRVGISADERRKDRKDFLIYDVFGKVTADVDRKTLIRDGFIHDVEIRLIPTSFEALWYVALTNEQKQDDGVFNRLVQEMAENAERNKIVADLAVADARAGRTLLVFSHRVAHCAELRAMIVERESRVGMFVGDAKYRTESDETSAGLRNRTIVCAVGTYQAIGTGVDVQHADRGIAVTPIHSNRQGAGQVRGRLCRIDRSPRPTKTDAILSVLWDRRVHGLVPLRNFLRLNDGNVKVRRDDGTWEDGRAFLKRAEADEEQAKQDARDIVMSFRTGAM